MQEFGIPAGTGSPGASRTRLCLLSRPSSHVPPGTTTMGSSRSPYPPAYPLYWSHSAHLILPRTPSIGVTPLTFSSRVPQYWSHPAHLILPRTPSIGVTPLTFSSPVPLVCRQPPSPFSFLPPASPPACPGTRTPFLFLPPSRVRSRHFPRRFILEAPRPCSFHPLQLVGQNPKKITGILFLNTKLTGFLVR